MAMLEIQEEGLSLEQAKALLNGIPGGFHRALQTVTRRAGKHIASDHTKKIRQRYAISTTTVKEEETSSIRYFFQNGAQVGVLFTGKRIHLPRFEVSPKRQAYQTNRKVPVQFWDREWRLVSPGVPVTGHILKSVAPRKFENSFVAAFHPPLQQAFERESLYRPDLKPLMGPSVPQMLGDEQVAEALKRETTAKTQEWLEQEILKLLEGRR